MEMLIDADIKICSNVHWVICVREEEWPKNHSLPNRKEKRSTGLGTITAAKDVEDPEATIVSSACAVFVFGSWLSKGKYLAW